MDCKDCGDERAECTVKIVGPGGVTLVDKVVCADCVSDIVMELPNEY